MIVIGIVGLKNSGKTFLAQKLIKYFSSKNFQVASIKHAHHNFEIDKPNTDSFLHRKAGASQVLISSKKRYAKIYEINNEKEKTLNELLNELESPDIVIVEGFKNEHHKKIEIINEKNKEFLFKKIKNVICLVTNADINTKIQIFRNDDIIKIANYILENAKN